MLHSNLEAIKALAETLPPQFAEIQNNYQPPKSSIKSKYLTLEQEALVDAKAFSKELLIQKYGVALATSVIETTKNQASTHKQAYGQHQQKIRKANAEFGVALREAGVQIFQHSVEEFQRVIIKQLDLQLQGDRTSVSEVLNAAFPNNPKKAVSIGNSRYGKRRKQAYNSEAVRNHPMEKAMQVTHGKESMNRRLCVRTFRESLSNNAMLFKTSDRITKLEARVHVLEQQMQSTKLREAFDDQGYTTSLDKVLALKLEGKGPTEIAKLLSMPLNTVRSKIRRSKKSDIDL